MLPRGASQVWLDSIIAGTLLVEEGAEDVAARAAEGTAAAAAAAAAPGPAGPPVVEAAAETAVAKGGTAAVGAGTEGAGAMGAAVADTQANLLLNRRVRIYWEGDDGAPRAGLRARLCVCARVRSVCALAGA